MKLALLFLIPAALLGQQPDVVPKRYTVSLRIDPAKDTFTGTALIEIQAGKQVSAIRLNAKELTVDSATVNNVPARAELFEDEFLTLHMAKPVGPGRVTLRIAYQAKLREKPTVGAFHTNFENHWYAFTTFTAIDARRAFPCFDEPRFKTEWNLTLHIPQSNRAFSNAAQISETEEEDGTKAVAFAPTPLLASEAVAFAVGPFDVVEAGNAGASGKVPVRVITPTGHATEATDAALATKDIVARLETYTGIPYPWAKLDHLALPEGTFGGVEQPGLITYRLKALLREPGKATPEQTLSMRGLLTHELAHQWFGNMVTQGTWEDVWLSEGFATWLTYRMMDQDLPLEKKHVSAVAGRERIMATDSGEKSRPVRLTLHGREEMKGVYSQFVYQKAGAVLLMVENWLGEEPFRKGLHLYLRSHRDGNASLEDLAAALKETSGIDVAPVLHSLLDNKGVPEIRIVTQCEAGKTAKLHVEVKGYTLPVCWTASGGESGCAVFDAAHADHDLTACPVWLNPNANGAGYYRSNLTPEQRSAIPEASLSEAERAALKPAESKPR